MQSYAIFTLKKKNCFREVLIQIYGQFGGCYFGTALDIDERPHLYTLIYINKVDKIIETPLSEHYT